MPSIFLTPGPIELYVKQRVAGVTPSAWSYLGTCNTSPEVEIQSAHNDVFNDLGGRQLPTARVFDGERHTVTLAINRYDPLVYHAIRARGSTSIAVPSGENLTRGCFVTGFNDALLLMLNAFKGTTCDGSSGTLPSGRMYYSATYMGGRENTTGTRVIDVTSVFHCDGLFIPATRRFSLYTEDPSVWGTVPSPT